MREKPRNPGRLHHILSAIEVIESNCKAYDYKSAKMDSVVFFGFVKLMEIIGETAYMLTDDFKLSHPETDWRVIEHMRHFLVHGYYQIDAEKVWETIDNDLPPQKASPEIFTGRRLFASTYTD